jgi:hypothetical protein
MVGGHAISKITIDQDTAGSDPLVSFFPVRKNVYMDLQLLHVGMGEGHGKDFNKGKKPLFKNVKTTKFLITK